MAIATCKLCARSQPHTQVGFEQYSPDGSDLFQPEDGHAHNINDTDVEHKERQGKSCRSGCPHKILSGNRFQLKDGQAHTDVEHEERQGKSRRSDVDTRTKYSQVIFFSRKTAKHTI